MRKYELKKKEVLSEENALEQMNLFLERYDIDIYSFPEKEQEQLIQNTDQVVSYIMQGRLEVAETDGQLKVTQHIKNLSENSSVNKLVFREVTGADKAQMKKDCNEHDKINQLMGSVCETAGGHSAVKQLRSGDRRVLEAIAGYFL